MGTYETTGNRTIDNLLKGPGWTQEQGFGKATGHQDMDGGAYRANTGKVQYELMPVKALEEIANVYTYGAQKYDPDNWRKGFKWRAVFGSGMRHMMAWLSGQDFDEESGLHHLAHAAVNMMFLLEYHFQAVGIDDRWKGIKEEE